MLRVRYPSAGQARSGQCCLQSNRATGSKGRTSNSHIRSSLVSSILEGGIQCLVRSPSAPETPEFKLFGRGKLHIPVTGFRGSLPERRRFDQGLDQNENGCGRTLTSYASLATSNNSVPLPYQPALAGGYKCGVRERHGRLHGSIAGPYAGFARGLRPKRCGSDRRHR